MQAHAMQWIRVFLAVTTILGAEPTAALADPRIRSVRYDPDAVVEITGHVGYATTVFFQREEVVESVAVGDDAWHIAPEGNRISLKPRGDDPYPASGHAASESDTNMTVWTDRRVYFFELRASRSQGSGERTYAVRFVYPTDSDVRVAETLARRREAGRKVLATGADAMIAGASTRSESPAEGATVRHSNYSWSGSESIRPVQAFDDGRFTYLRFANRAPLPAIYIGEEDGTESIVNLHIRDHWVVIHRVARRLVLRDGALVACVFRESGHDL